MNAPDRHPSQLHPSADNCRFTLRLVVLTASMLGACFGTDTFAPNVAREDRAIGSACEWNAQCGSDLCIPPQIAGQSTGWPDGMCTSNCNERSCGADETCTLLLDGNYCLPRCNAEGGSCREGYVCEQEMQACLPDCRLGWTCGSSMLCSADTGLCTFERAGEGTANGDPCKTSLECASGICIPEKRNGTPTGWTGGMCAIYCPQGKCAANESCTRLGKGLYCLPACGQSCRQGYVCNEHLAVCLPDCRQGWDCGEGFDCRSDGQCKTQAAVQSALGEPCAQHFECETGICFSETGPGGNTGWTDGICAGICGSQHCDARSQCLKLGGSLWCMPYCISPRDCRSGYVCNPFLSACIPDCRSGWDCGDFVCDTATGSCIAPVSGNPGNGGPGPGPGSGSGSGSG